ncbi:MAG: 2-oxo acid dehydrogenase subunit E2 [Solirubrobacterales bacterium]
MSDIVMPRLSDSMTEGTVVRWLKQPGQAVTRGEPIVEIETDKATITYESDSDGVFAEILVAEGQTVAVGTQIARVEQSAGAAAQPPQDSAQQQQQTGQQPPAFDPQQQPAYESSAARAGEYVIPGGTAEQEAVGAQPTQPQDESGGDPAAYAADVGAAARGDDSRVKASPIARRLARKLGVDLSAVAGTGPGGRVVKEDVEAAANVAAAGPPSPPTQAQSEPQQEFAPLPIPDDSELSPPPLPMPDDSEFSPPPLPMPDGQAHEPLPLPPDEPVYEQPHPTGEDPQFAQPTTQPTTQPTDQPTDQPTGDQPAYSPAGESEPQLSPPGGGPDFAPPLSPPPPPMPPPPMPPQYQPPTPEQPPIPGGQLPGGQPFPMPPTQPQPPGQYPPPMPGMQPPVGYPQPPMPLGPQPGLPGPAPFVSGMTGGFPAIQPGAGAPGETATRGQSTQSALSSSQQTVARRMAESKATAPDFFVEIDVDMTSAVNFREQMKMSVQPTPSFNDFVIRASAQALRNYPKINGAYKDGHFEQYGDVNIGIVVASGELLAVPVLGHADQKGLAQIARESRELAAAVRNRTIQPNQLSGGTFSISNLGMYGVDRFTAILNAPQAAILAVGAIRRKPIIAEDGISLAVRQVMTLTLTCDHRIIYGAEGAEFLGAVKAWLESPQSLPI